VAVRAEARARDEDGTGAGQGRSLRNDSSPGDGRPFKFSPSIRRSEDMENLSLRTRLLVGTFATVLIVGSGVATALVTSSDQPTTTESTGTSTSTGDTADTTTPSTPGSTEGTTPAGDAGTGDAGKDDTTGPVARYSGPECGDGELTNHGQYVSSQPKDGESRSAAAQSDCGKPLTSVGDGDDAGDDESGDAPDADAPESGDAPANSGSGHGNSADAPGHNK